MRCIAVVDTTIGELRVLVEENQQRNAEIQARLEQLVEERLPALQEAASHIAYQLTRYPTLRSVLSA